MPWINGKKKIFMIYVYLIYARKAHNKRPDLSPGRIILQLPYEASRTSIKRHIIEKLTRHKNKEKACCRQAYNL